ncbi:putative leader peptide [Streptomyces cinerochromogenes]|uniref:putative leader peptide n=1 Tax=Streptomyces cinerochromogenes TaxID=66422 RepID=UPI0033BFA32F
MKAAEGIAPAGIDSAPASCGGAARGPGTTGAGRALSVMTRSDRRPPARPAASDAREVTAVTRVPPQARAPRAVPPYRSVRLHSRPHIDLQRVSAALCRP